MGIGKNFETRSWPTTHKGPILIHAAKRWTAEEVDLCEDPPFYDVLAEAGFAQFTPGGIYTRMNLPLGAIVAKAVLYECARTESVKEWLESRKRDNELAFGNYSPGRWVWKMMDIQPLKVPIPYRGSQGLFKVPDDLIAEALAK